VRKILSPIASMPFAITGACRLGALGKRECCFGFGKRVCQFVPGDPLEAAVRRARADWESVRKRAD